jgi:hypothetical protein
MPAPVEDLKDTPALAVEVNYASIDPTSDRPPFYNTTDPDVETNVLRISHTVPIHDMRGREHELGLDTTGWEVVKTGESVEKEFVDEERIRDLYYPECIECVLGHLLQG